MKLIFAVLYVSRYKTEVFFTLIFAVFQFQSIAEILLVLLQHLENKRTPYGNSTSGLEFELFIVIGM